MDDLISRAAATKRISDMIHEYREKGEYRLAEGVYLALQCVWEQLPAVDAAPVVHAEWIEESDREGHYHCSNCGVVWGVSAMAMKYCPNCTAKMTNSPLWDMEDEAATEMAQYCERYEPTYNPEDGSM